MIHVFTNNITMLTPVIAKIVQSVAVIIISIPFNLICREHEPLSSAHAIGKLIYDTPSNGMKDAGMYIALTFIISQSLL